MNCYYVQFYRVFLVLRDERSQLQPTLGPNGTQWGTAIPWEDAIGPPPVLRLLFGGKCDSTGMMGIGFSLWIHPQMGLSENRVYSQWNSHLIGIMISKTIGYTGVHYFQTHPNGWSLQMNYRCNFSSDARWNKRSGDATNFKVQWNTRSDISHSEAII